MKQLLKYRRPLVVGFHLMLTALSHYIAFWLRFDGEIPAQQVMRFHEMLPWLLAMRGLSFIPFRLYEGLWRYTSLWDLRNIIGGVLTSSVAFYLLVRFAFGLVSYPQSVFLIDTVLLVVLLSAVRLVRRIHRELWHLARDKRMLIYGAGAAGEMIVRDLHHNSFYEYEPVGFIDDDQAKVGQRIHGVRVLGTRAELARVIGKVRPDVVLVAMPRAGPATIRSIVHALEPFKVPIQILPDLRAVLGGRVTVKQIRTLSVEDLLERVPLGLDTDLSRNLVKGRRVLVTGAGGSIGAELARQIAAFGPAELVLLDRYENGLHRLALELAPGTRRGTIEAVVGDVTDADRINAVLAAHRPAIIFHAAAHKHVPLMELNPCEAVRNNVSGTRILAEAGRRFGVERFILISTDKAVNPSSVMGATKRVAELLIQDMNSAAPGVFAAVRFGNVLASNGSVVPRFVEQIQAGGPVTVTHPEMRRHFMLISEAVHLVLQAAALAKGGDTFVLDMGEQIRVLDLARNLIRLSGFVPDEEIRIEFVGIRPGEKLSEELIDKDESAEPVAGYRILRVQRSLEPESRLLARQVADLERLVTAADAQGVIRCLGALVPTYRPARFDP